MLGSFGSGLDLIGLWLGVTVSYIAAFALIAGGVYLALFVSLTNPFAKPLRFIGLCLIAAGCVFGAYTFGKAAGASACEAAWKAKNYEAQIARLRQERDAKDAAASEARDSLSKIAEEKGKADAKVADYEAATRNLSEALAACRRASADDDRRVCDITGQSAAGCEPAR